MGLARPACNGTAPLQASTRPGSRCSAVKGTVLMLHSYLASCVCINWLYGYYSHAMILALSQFKLDGGGVIQYVWRCDKDDIAEYTEVGREVGREGKGR